MPTWEEVEEIVRIVRSRPGLGGFQEVIEEADQALRRLIPHDAALILPSDLSLFVSRPSGLVHADPAQAANEAAFCDYPQEILERYFDYMPYDRYMPRMVELDGKALDWRTLYAKDVVGREPFTAEFLPQTEFSHAAYFGASDRVRGTWVTWSFMRHRSQEEFTEAELRLLQLLGPDLVRLSQAALLHARLGKATRAPAHAAEGAALFNLQGHLLTLTPAAEGLLEAGNLTPEDLDLWVRAQVQQGRPHARVERQSAAGTWIRLTLSEVPGLRVVVIRRLPAGSADRFDAGAAALGLTGRQREVAELAVVGRSNSEIAYSLGISAETVKRHLAQVYRKAGVSGRTELASLLLGRRTDAE